MKRSVMEKKIASVLNNVGVIKVDNLFKAQAILDEIESLGMLPPETVIGYDEDNQMPLTEHVWTDEKNGN